MHPFLLFIKPLFVLGNMEKAASLNFVFIVAWFGKPKAAAFKQAIFKKKILCDIDHSRQLNIWVK